MDIVLKLKVLDLATMVENASETGLIEKRYNTFMHLLEEGSDED